MPYSEGGNYFRIHTIMIQKIRVYLTNELSAVSTGEILVADPEKENFFQNEKKFDKEAFSANF